MYGIGIMSGTSLDGIDTVLVKITGYSTNTKRMFLRALS